MTRDEFFSLPIPDYKPHTKQCGCTEWRNCLVPLYDYLEERYESDSKISKHYSSIEDWLNGDVAADDADDIALIKHLWKGCK